MKHTIRGEQLPIVDIELQTGESVFTERGGMAWMSNNINMKTGTRGGLGKALGRVFAGESLFMNTYSCEEGTGLISFCSEFPGSVVEFNLQPGESIICQRDAFMVAETSVDMSMHFTRRLGAGLFGGEGFFLQKLTGPGKAFIELSGEITEYNLKEGQVLKVDPGYLAAYEPSVDFNLTTVKGVSNLLFGGEGIFLATVQGPGKVWLQSMPIQALAKKIGMYIPKKR